MFLTISDFRGKKPNLPLHIYVITQRIKQSQKTKLKNRPRNQNRDALTSENIRNWGNGLEKRWSWTPEMPSRLILSYSLAKNYPQKLKYNTWNFIAFAQIQSVIILYNFQKCLRSLISATLVNFQVLGHIFSRWKLPQREAPREHTQEGKVKNVRVYLYSSSFSALHLMSGQIFTFELY